MAPMGPPPKMRTKSSWQAGQWLWPFRQQARGSERARREQSAFAGSRLRLISAESVKIAEAQYGQAMSGHWPQIKFSMTGVRMDEDPMFMFPSQPLNLGAAGRPFAEAIANAQLAKMGITPRFGWRCRL